MKTFAKITGIAVVVVALAVASVAVVSAQGPQGNQPASTGTMWQRMREAMAEALGTARQRLQQDGVDGWGRMPHRFGGNRGAMGFGSNSLVGVAADKLGLTSEQLQDELESGKTIAQIAQTKGVELQTIVDAFLAPRAAVLDTAVEQSRITREQADERIDHMEEEAREHLEEAYPWQCDSSDCAELMEGGAFGLGGCMGDETQGSGRGVTRSGRGLGMMGRGNR